MEGCSGLKRNLWSRNSDGKSLYYHSTLGFLWHDFSEKVLTRINRGILTVIVFKYASSWSVYLSPEGFSNKSWRFPCALRP